MKPRVNDVDEVRKLVVPDARVIHSDELVREIARCGAVLRGHFSLQSGEHAEHFLRFRDLAPVMDRLAEWLLGTAPFGPGDRLLAPESSGSYLAEAIRTRTNKPLAICKVDLRRSPMEALRTGAIRAGESVVIVNDVATTGRSLQPLVELVERHSAHVVGVLLFAAFDPEAARDALRPRQVPVATLATLRWKRSAHGPTTCAGCKAGIPLMPSIDLN